MKKVSFNSQKGILFWITGLSGSGKSSIAKNIYPKIKKKYGPTILLNGDDMRKIFNLNKYDKKSRLDNGLNFSNFSKNITNQGVNVIFANIGMFHRVRKKNRLNIDNYIEIYIESNLNQIIKKGKKKIYTKYRKNIVGKDIVPELPRAPDIKIANNFEKTINQISIEILKNINKIL